MKRCEWAEGSDLLRAYHDEEWGVEIHDDTKLFEFLILEGAQAGLSWSTILKKRDGYRTAFHNFDAGKISMYSESDISALCANPDIVRNRLKIKAVVTNSAVFLRVQKEFGSFDTYIWRFVSGKTIKNEWKRMTEVPSRSPESDAMSKDMVQRGFKFTGTTICYAFMQAVGMVNDHVMDCFRYERLGCPKLVGENL
ncbi:MAG: DNA-3-methyladenine glycosylase I [Syntrophobacterales bacterium]|nr:DNA-3-methyladenine glycosylase I [Syntrophobacterales bacterium]